MKQQDEVYIQIPDWERFQHYKDRDPPWIKNYVKLLHKDEYLSLSGHARGILHGIWMTYSTSHRQLRGDTATLSRRLNLKVTRHDLEALVQAGFIQLVASTVLAKRYQDASKTLALARARALAIEEEREKPLTTDVQGSSSTTNQNYATPPLDGDDLKTRKEQQQEPDDYNIPDFTNLARIPKIELRSIR